MQLASDWASSPALIHCLLEIEMKKDEFEKQAADFAEKTAETVETATKESIDVVRKIWLAGVGAYGKMYEQAQGQFGKVQEATQEVFEQLVQQGEKVEELVKTKISQSPTAEKASQQFQDFAHKASEQVKEYRETRLTDIEAKLDTLGKTIVEKVQPFNVFAMGQKIEELTAQVASLQAELAALKTPAAPKPARKTAAKKD